MPLTVTEFGDGAFRGCSHLAEVQLNEGLQVVDHSVFGNCEALQSITLPSAITMWGTDAFHGCINLSKVHLDEELQAVGATAFQHCTALQSVIIPPSVTRLEYGVFYGCHNLLEVQLNEGLQIIGQSVFYACTALRSVTIPSTVTRLGTDSFDGCSNLSDMILLGGEWLLDQEFISRGVFSEEQGILNHEMLSILIDGSTFRHCPLARVKISISWAVSERMARLPPEGRVSVKTRILNLPRLELRQDGNVLACFPLVSRESDDDAEEDFDTEMEICLISKIQITRLPGACTRYFS